MSWTQVLQWRRRKGSETLMGLLLRPRPQSPPLPFHSSPPAAPASPQTQTLTPCHFSGSHRTGCTGEDPDWGVVVVVVHAANQLALPQALYFLCPGKAQAYLPSWTVPASVFFGVLFALLFVLLLFLPPPKKKPDALDFVLF